MTQLARPQLLDEGLPFNHGAVESVSMEVRDGDIRPRACSCQGQQIETADGHVPPLCVEPFDVADDETGVLFPRCNRHDALLPPCERDKTQTGLGRYLGVRIVPNPSQKRFQNGSNFEERFETVLEPFGDQL